MTAEARRARRLPSRGAPGLGDSLRRAARPHRVSSLPAFAVLMVLLVSAVVGSVVIGIAIGSVRVAPTAVVDIVLGHLVGGEMAVTATEDRIIWVYRTPRVLLAAVVGAGLAVAGAALQAVVRNPLADPYLLGTASGASAGAVTVLVLGSGAVAGLGLSAAAFVGASIATAVTVLLGQKAGRFSPTRLILAGVAVAALLSAVTSYIQLQADPNEIAGVIFWLLGSLSGSEWSDLGLPSAVVLASTLWLLGSSRRLSVMASGDESAASLGVPVTRFRLTVILVTSALVGTAVAVVGAVGFVGLMIPHVARMLVGPDHRRVLPVTALVGALFVVVIDLLARTVQAPSELPLGIFTALIGAPFFAWLLSSTSRLSGSD